MLAFVSNLVCLYESTIADVFGGSTTIFFDGYLPEYKKTERLSRIRQSSVVANNYFLATSAGVPSETNPKSLDEASEHRPLSTLTTKRRHQALPVPSFLVPAVLDALRSSSRYGHLTRLVPGEADPFCAQAVKQDGGTLLTSDSDLLLYDLGPDGNVVFLNDINISETLPYATTVRVAKTVAQTRIVSALVHNQHSILKKVSPRSSREDLLAFAYDLTLGSYSSLSQWATKSETQHSTNHDDDYYHDFVSRYQGMLNILISGDECMRFLDPRIAEFVLSVSGNILINDPTLDSQSQSTPVFYLPQLLDRWDLGSAWKTGQYIRELAYSICCNGPGDHQAIVVEYRRALSASPQGQEVRLSNGEHMAQTLKDMFSSISRFVEAPVPCSRSLSWIALCLSFELSDAVGDGKPSVVLESWKKAARANYSSDPGDWDTIHLAAHIQGTLYSLRILQQILKCWLAGLVQGPQGMNKGEAEAILGQLSSLPSLVEYPCAVDMADLFEKLLKSGMCALIELTTGISPPIPSEKDRKKHRKKMKQQQEQKTAGRQQASRLTSPNPFELLNADG